MYGVKALTNEKLQELKMNQLYDEDEEDTQDDLEWQERYDQKKGDDNNE